MRLFVVLLAWAALLPGFARAVDPFRVCVLEYDGPLADKAKGKGFDLDVGRAVAEQLGRPFQPVWIANEARMTEVDDSDLPLMPLAKGKCDATPSVPGREALDELDDHLVLSRPYYGAGFELVGPEGTEPDVMALRGKTVSVQSVTIAHGVAEAIGIKWSAQPTVAEQIALLDSKKVEAALVWGPALGDFDRAPVAGYVPPALLRWNESFATRKSDPETAKAIDTALALLLDNGTIAKLMKANGIPVHGPFDKVFDGNEMRMLQLQGAAQPRPTAEPAAKTTTTPIAPGTGDDTKPAETKTDAAPAASGGASPAAAYIKDAAAVKRGKLIYTGTCGAYCHPSSADAVTDAPYLFDCTWKDGDTDQQIFHTIKAGVKGTRMVAFGEALPEDDIWKVIAYLRSASKCEAQKPK